MQRLEMPMDYFTIRDDLDKIQTYECDRQTESQYYDYYQDEINELSIIAADMWNELNQMIDHLFYHQLPYKNVGFYVDDNAKSSDVSWFNTATAMITDINMTTLLENEENYDTDEDKEKRKRLNALDKLTKPQMKYLFSEVFNFIHRFTELKWAFEMIKGLIDELDYHQSVIRPQEGEPILNDAAWVE